MISYEHAGVCPYCARRNKAKDAPKGALAGHLFGLLAGDGMGKDQRWPKTQQQAAREIF